MDVYRIATAAVVLGIAWVVEVVGVSTVRNAVAEGEPKPSPFSLDDISAEESIVPFGELAKTHGVEIDQILYTDFHYRRDLKQYRRDLRLGLAGAIGGAALVFSYTLRLWGSMGLAATAVIVGPFVIAAAKARAL